MMEAEADYKKKNNGNEEMNSKVKYWMPPHVMMDFTLQLLHCGMKSAS